MAKNPKAPKVPGEAAAPSAPSSTEKPNTENAKPDTGETVTVSKAQLEDLMSRLNALESAPRPVVRRANPDAELPDQDDIDATAIKSPVLTKQGWLVPDTFGSHKNAPK